MKSGFIAVLGKPNVGKSSLINALIGEKVSIVSPRAQTTRDRIMGVLTEDGYQMVFVDTPGIHKPKNRLGDYMLKCVKEAEKGADAIVLVLDSQKSINEGDFQLIEKYAALAPLYIVISKTDLTGFEKIYPTLQKIADFTADKDFKGIRDVIPLSAKTKFNVEVLKSKLKEELTDTNQYFPDEDISDKPISYMVCEIIREKALWLLSDEVPHGIGVALVSMKEDKDLTRIDADVICERDAHKQIILGEGGSMIKEIGTRARLEIEKLLGAKVFLKLFVKVRENWRNKPGQIRDAGYEDN